IRTPSVYGDFATDGAGALTQGIRRLEVTLRLDGQRDVEVDYAGLHHGALIREVDLQNPVHAREADGDAAGSGNSATAQAGAGAAAHDRDFVLARDLDDRDHVLGCARKHHHLRTRLVDAAVVFIQQQVFWPVQISASA